MMNWDEEDFLYSDDAFKASPRWDWRMGFCSRGTVNGSRT